MFLRYEKSRWVLLWVWGTGNQVSAFSDCCYMEVHEAGELMWVSSGSYWQNSVKVRSVVGQESYCLCGVGGKYQKNGREGRNHKVCRQSSQNGQRENKGAKDEVGGVISPVLHPELQVCCSILCSSGINVLGWVVPTANSDKFIFCLPAQSSLLDLLSLNYQALFTSFWCKSASISCFRKLWIFWSREQTQEAF